VQICAEGREPLQKEYRRVFGVLSGICGKQIPLIFSAQCAVTARAYAAYRIQPLRPIRQRGIKFQFVVLFRETDCHVGISCLLAMT